MKRSARRGPTAIASEAEDLTTGKSCDGGSGEPRTAKVNSASQGTLWDPHSAGLRVSSLKARHPEGRRRPHPTAARVSGCSEPSWSPSCGAPAHLPRAVLVLGAGGSTGECRALRSRPRAEHPGRLTPAGSAGRPPPPHTAKLPLSHPHPRRSQRVATAPSPPVHAGMGQRPRQTPLFSPSPGPSGQPQRGSGARRVATRCTPPGQPRVLACDPAAQGQAGWPQPPPQRQDSAGVGWGHLSHWLAAPPPSRSLWASVGGSPATPSHS